MSLIVEDGTQVANANTYVSDSDYTTYATARGATVGADATAREIELIKAMDYIESFRNDFQGRKTSSTQALQFPRIGVYIDGYSINSDSIPGELQRAQMEAAIINNSTDILPGAVTTTPTQNVQKEKVGSIEKEYFDQGQAVTTVNLTSVMVYLQPLMFDVKQLIRT